MGRWIAHHAARSLELARFETRRATQWRMRRQMQRLRRSPTPRRCIPTAVINHSSLAKLDMGNGLEKKLATSPESGLSKARGRQSASRSTAPNEIAEKTTSPRI